MTYREDAAARGADLLSPVVMSALIKAAEGLLGGANDELGQAVIRQPQRAVQILTAKLVSVDAITPDSADAAIDAAINTAGTLAFMKAQYGIA